MFVRLKLEASRANQGHPVGSVLFALRAGNRDPGSEWFRYGTTSRNGSSDPISQPILIVQSDYIYFLIYLHNLRSFKQIKFTEYPLKRKKNEEMKFEGNTSDFHSTNDDPVGSLVSVGGASASKLTIQRQQYRTHYPRVSRAARQRDLFRFCAKQS